MSEKNLKTSTPTSTRSKRSTASDTGTKKSRWFRLGTAKPELPEIDHLLDFYWGGPERRITGLTIRIIAVNAIALVILMVGVLYLGQYQNSLIEAKLETFQAEAELISAAVSEGAIEEYEQPAALPYEQGKMVARLVPDQARRMINRLSQTMGKRILLFDADGILIGDSHKLVGPGGVVQIVELEPVDQTLYSLQILKSMAAFIIKLLPDKRALPIYPEVLSELAIDYPDAAEAMEGQISLSAWYNEDGSVFLSAAAPLHTVKQVVGAVLLTREGKDIEEAIGKVWIDVLKVFLGTLLVTIMLSIYLSGVIARPLRKLAKAAEDVRTGKSKGTEIPDLSYRHDEIGELSIVLREMTQALWDRMDSIENFAADVAHELKNPLTSLRSAIETASVVKKKEDRDKLFDIITHDLERLDRLISDISSASRLDSELSREEFKAIHLKKALIQLVDSYKNPLERDSKKLESSMTATVDGINVQLSLNDEQDIYVWGLEGRLAQVFQNLITNAVSFSPKDGVVNISVIAGNRRVTVTVEDQGPGIPNSKLENVFERFYSERPEHEDYGRHSGLGLSICRQIIDAHQGHIFAENIKDSSGKIAGARFSVVLTML